MPAAALAIAVLTLAILAERPIAQDTWRGLVVAPEYRRSPYDRGDYRYPQSIEDEIVAALGGDYGPYTGRWSASDCETDIEHMVAVSEACDSGLCATGADVRRSFATGLLNLTLAAGGSWKSSRWGAGVAAATRGGFRNVRSTWRIAGASSWTPVSRSSTVRIWIRGAAPKATCTSRRSRTPRALPWLDGGDR